EQAPRLPAVAVRVRADVAAVGRDAEAPPRAEPAAVPPAADLPRLELVRQVQPRVARLRDLDRRVRAIPVLDELAVVAVRVVPPAPADPFEMEMRIRLARPGRLAAEADAAARTAVGGGAPRRELRERLQEDV